MNAAALSDHQKLIHRAVTVALAGLVAVAVTLTPSVGAIAITGNGAGLNQANEQVSGTGTSFRVGVRTQATGMNRGHGCTASGAVWVQEHLKSGITKFKARWELRGYYDSGVLPTYGSVGWWRTTSFANDYESYWVDFTLPFGYLNFSAGKQFSLWAKAVGERPSWWRPDLTRRVRVGEPACNRRLPAA